MVETQKWVHDVLLNLHRVTKCGPFSRVLCVVVIGLSGFLVRGKVVQCTEEGREDDMGCEISEFEFAHHSQFEQRVVHYMSIKEVETVSVSARDHQRSQAAQENKETENHVSRNDHLDRSRMDSGVF